MAELVKSQLDCSFDVKTLEWVRSLWPGKLIVKGILDRRGRENGARRRRGRDPRLQSRRTSARQRAFYGVGLPASSMRSATRPKSMWTAACAPGLDVLKFLGLGARACFIGRAYLYGLGAYGQAGVTKALDILQGRAQHRHGADRRDRR